MNSSLSAQVEIAPKKTYPFTTDVIYWSCVDALKHTHSQASAYAHTRSYLLIWLMQVQGRTDASMSLPCHRNHN